MLGIRIELDSALEEVSDPEEDSAKVVSIKEHCQQSEVELDEHVQENTTTSGYCSDYDLNNSDDEDNCNGLSEPSKGVSVVLASQISFAGSTTNETPTYYENVPMHRDDKSEDDSENETLQEMPKDIKVEKLSSNWN